MARDWKLEVLVHKIVADTLTPVSIYLKIRDIFPNSVLLESTEYEPNQYCFSYICFDQLASLRVQTGEIRGSWPDGSSFSEELGSWQETVPRIESYLRSFKVNSDPQYHFISNGFFGYIAFDAVQYFEDITLQQEWGEHQQIPEVCLQAYRYVIAMNHHRQETYLLENKVLGVGENELPERSRVVAIKRLLERGPVQSFDFTVRPGSEVSNFNDAEHRDLITTCQKHVYRGDVFQIVPSRRYSLQFEGDEFNVYRALRIINPSPFLFYFDFGGFRIFGSAPEAQLLVRGTKASIYPIAGTCVRGDDEHQDQALIEALMKDPKENAEHVMLVDLARNDLSRHCEGVQVEAFREVHRYSHVIHLVSKVSGIMSKEVSALQLLADTFPAGTLSGAPKYRALELIDRYERGRRGYYGGALGFFEFGGDCTLAIMIRSFLSKDGWLHRQAGGGIVADSEVDTEVQEIRNKLGALGSALVMAREL